MLKFLFVSFVVFSFNSTWAVSTDLSEKKFVNAKSSEKYNGVNGLSESEMKDLEDDGAYTDSSEFKRVEFEKECADKDCTCGTGKVSIAKKIEDCQRHKIIGKYSKFLAWKLVTRAAPSVGRGVFNLGREVWLDTDTKMLWSSRVSNSVNWCHASGSDASYRDTFKICHAAPYQIQEAPVSACSDNKKYTPSPAVDNLGKGGLGLNSNPKVVWRLPSLNDYHRALANGLIHVVPDSRGLGTWEWSSTVFSPNKAMAWDVSTQLGEVGNDDRRGYNAARCVAEYKPE